MQSAHLSDAIIVTEDPSLVKAASEPLRTRGVAHISVQQDLEGARDVLARFTKALLVLDHALGHPMVASILSASRTPIDGGDAQGGMSLALRPVMLVAHEVSEAVIATAAEYGVTQIYTDERTARALGPRLNALLLAETIPDDIRAGLAQLPSLAQAGDQSKIIKVLAPLLAKYPQNLRLRSEVANYLIAQGESPRALELLKDIEQVTPPYLRGLHLKGRALLRLGRPQEALTVLEKASLLNPSDVDRLTEIGQSLLHLGRTNEASQNFARALTVDPRAKAAKVGQGQCHILEGDINEALSILKDVSGELEKASLFNTCGVMASRQRQTQKALELYSTALAFVSRSKSTSALIHYNIALAHRRVGHVRDAITSLEEALALAPDYEKARTLLSTLQSSLHSGAHPSPGAPQSPLAPQSMSRGESAKGPVTADSSLKKLESVFAPIDLHDPKALSQLFEDDLEESSFASP